MFHCTKGLLRAACWGALWALVLGWTGIIRAQALIDAPADVVPSVPPAPSAVAEPADVFANVSPDDEARVRQIVQQYLNELDAQRQAAAAVPHPSVSAEGDPLTMKASWKNGLTLESQNKQFKAHVGGRTQFDTAWFGVPDDIQNDPTIANPYGDGVGFRRVRMKVDGSMYEFIEWAFQVDFVNSTRNGTNNQLVPAPTDLWWAFTHLPAVGNIKVGNQKEPIGFEHLVSSRFLPFMERSFNQDAFYGGFNNGFTPGISAYNTAFDENVTWAIGAYKPTNNAFAYSTNSGDYAATGRVTFLPWYECDGEELVHLGFSARQASSFDGNFRFRTRGPERSGISSVWPLPADTGNFRADDEQQLNAEFVVVRGPWTFQSEYLLNLVHNAFRADGTPVDAALFHGGYAQLFYFLTGEHDQYNRKSAVFDRVIPRENARPSTSLGGLLSGGAWQVGVRYNYLDLNSDGINGSVLNDMTAGLNWYLNPNLKVQWNYSATHRQSGSAVGDGWIHGFGVRVAQDF